MRSLPNIPGLKPLPEAALELGGVRGDELAAELRKDGVPVFEFKVGRSVARLVHPDEYARWLARRTGVLTTAAAEPAPDWPDFDSQLQRQAAALDELQRQVQTLLARGGEGDK